MELLIDKIEDYFQQIEVQCNSGDYEKARQELDRIEPYCKTPAEQARLHYSRGYLNYATVSQLMALLEYRRGLRADPSDSLKLKKDCKYAEKLIKKEYDELARVSADVVNMIDLRFHEVAEDEKKEVDERTFQLFLGFHQSIRPPGIDNSILGFPPKDIFLGFEAYFAKLTGEKQETAKKFLQEVYHITDRKSFLDCMQNNSNMRILKVIGNNPTLSQSQIAEMLGEKHDTNKYRMRKMRLSGIIRRLGQVCFHSGAL